MKSVTTVPPVFVLTMGDPAGIGPEIAIKALSSRKIGRTRIVIIGDLLVLGKTAKRLRLPVRFNQVMDIRSAVAHQINVFDMRKQSPSPFAPGRLSAACGAAAYAYILKGIELAKKGIAAGVITNPINKEAFKLAGIHYPGHTEIFAHETGISEFTMLFYLDGVGVAHVTTHCSLLNSIKKITTSRVLSHIKLLDAAMQQLGVITPRIAVGGLNPHAGENGLFGNEEIRQIIPAIEKARALGINVLGPYPPDTVFMRAFMGEFDGVVSMLHDHGFVALKSRDFEHGVNITIGLPIIRTSVGHGTAFDRAGKGTASPESLIAAIRAAERLFENGKKVPVSSGGSTR